MRRLPPGMLLSSGSGLGVRARTLSPPGSGVQQALATVHRPLIYAGIIALLAILPGGGAGGAAWSVLYADGPRVRHCGHRRLDHRGHGRPGAEQSALFARWEPKEAPERGPVPWLGVRYRARTQRFSGSLRPALLVTAACGLVAVAILPFVNTALTPTFQDRNVVVRLQGQPDVSSEAMSQRATDLGNTIRALPGITGVGAADPDVPSPETESST